jgi:hypothetical protein
MSNNSVSFHLGCPFWRTGIRFLAAFCWVLCVATAAQPPLISTSGYLMSAYYVPVASRATLQTALNAYKTIRLDPNANYAIGGPATLVVQSGEKIYGLPGTIVPPIVVNAGTTEIVLSNVQTNSVTFPASASVTHDNLFVSVHSKAIATGATLENNLFLDWVGAYWFDDSGTGHFRNNRFIRSHENGVDMPYLRLKGNAGDSSYGNVFLFYNFLTPHGNGTDLAGLTDLTFVGVDSESWNFSDLGTEAVITTASDVNTLKFFVANGGDFVHSPADPNATGYFDIASPSFMLYNDIATSAHPIKLRLRSTVQQASLFNADSQDFGTGFQKDASSTAVFSGDQNVASITPAPKSPSGLAMLQNQILGVISGSPATVAWEAPVYDAIPDPGGASWNANLASKPDSTAYIQGLIESHGIAFLPAGTYYISAPLRLKSTQGLIGAGMASTLIVAKTPTIDMIIGDDHSTAFCTAAKFILSDLTLQGGANGIHHDPNGSGPGAQYTGGYLSHVTFRNMSNAGIFVDSIVAWDNNFIDHVNFVNNAIGIEQRVSPSYTGGEANGESYLDKNLFWLCQFVGNGIGVYLPAVRPDNLNIWADNLFSANTNGAMQLAGNLSPVVANSDFVNNGGSAVIITDGNSLSFVASRFSAGTLGKVFFGGSVSVEGSTFEQAGGNASLISSSIGGITSMFNSYSQDVPAGPVKVGYFFNNKLYGSSMLSVQGAVVQGGRVSQLLPYSLTAQPATQLLLGQPLQIRY